MSMDVAFNQAATIPAAVAALGFLVTALIYGFGSPWYRYLLGIVLFGYFIGTVPILLVVVLSRILAVVNGIPVATTGDGLGVFRFIVYLFAAIISIAVLAALLIERRNSHIITIPIRKANS